MFYFFIFVLIFFVIFVYTLSEHSTFLKKLEEDRIFHSKIIEKLEDRILKLEEGTINFNDYEKSTDLENI